MVTQPLSEKNVSQCYLLGRKKIIIANNEKTEIFI